MLDSVTKGNIDEARNILVGKVPVPQSQVEQITIALIYKFMDDMDREVKELGGKPSFFKGEFSKYSWSNIFSPSISGHDLVKLYGEALEKMNLNPNIPQLFRDIFKNAYLPYRDPETLKSFLKIINEFHYSHSEKLGDAFEYLLSILGSQGDAGQFRTPRHIIDFIVEVVSPSKTDKILDPACGTAGFLISAYKHIMKNNMKKVPGDTLKPEEKKTLIKNFCGYDISPDMVRLSLVNMYLHGFSEPKIYEYDTLTSEDRWTEYYDVILANPPFMSPKGGIKPHKRFSLQAKRSEVLFVDYICEHLTPDGKAGVIVPEGIIFQSGTAYKQLRKMLVEKYLWAVVSLPSGVFNPYAGVKTSILLLDKNLSKKSDKILFVKIENDGFDLGAQRREIDKNDLPEAIKILSKYKENPPYFVIPAKAGIKSLLFVVKEKLLSKDDCSLSMDRYLNNARIINGKYPRVKLGQLCEFEYGKPLKEENRSGKGYPVFGSNGIVGYHSEYLVEAPFIVIGRKGSAGAVHFSENNGTPIDTTFFVKLKNEDEILIKFLFHCLHNLDLKNVNVQAGVPGLNRNDAYELEIPLPPLSVQQEIVNKIDGYQKIIDGARQIIENYKPQIEINPNWRTIELRNICEIINGRAYKQEELLKVGKYPVLRVGNFFSNRNWYYSDLELDQNKYCDKGDLLYAWSASFGAKIWDGEKVIYHYHIWKIICDEKIINKIFLFYILNKYTEDIKTEGGRGIAMIHITKEGMEKREIPLPSLEEQQIIVSRIQDEQKLIDANKELIVLYEQKINDELNIVF